MSRKVYIGLGSNIGNREKNIYHAIQNIKTLQFVSLAKQSSIYVSSPIGQINQPFFYNSVVSIYANVSPHKLLYYLKKIERKLGRPRNHKRWGSRIIDLDILIFEDQVIRKEILQVPHPEMHKRKFVLAPLLEISDPIHPIFKKRVSTLLHFATNYSTVKKL